MGLIHLLHGFQGGHVGHPDPVAWTLQDGQGIRRGKVAKRPWVSHDDVHGSTP